MFDNAGRKIKTLAMLMFGVIFVGGSILGVKLFDDKAVKLLVVVISLVGGWLSTLAMYAFGELCENVYEINAKLKGTSTGVSGFNPVNTVENNEIPTIPPQSGDVCELIICPKCGKETPNHFKYCVNCEKKIK